MPKALITFVLLFLFSFIFINSTNAIDDKRPVKPAIGSVDMKDATNDAKRKLAQEKVEARKDKIEEKLANIKAVIASREAALKAKLELFRDKNKAQIAEKVNTSLNRINQNQTDAMKRHLDTMSLILNKLETRVNQSSPDIKDPVAARSAIASARSTIATVSAAVTAQAQKDYTIQVTTESRIRVATKTQRDKLFTDLKDLRKSVIEAKQSVVSAIRASKSNSATSSAAPSPSASDSGTIKEGTASGQQ